MNPDADRQGSGYQVNQSLIAVGSGGIWEVVRVRRRISRFFRFPRLTSSSLRSRKSMDL